MITDINNSQKLQRQIQSPNSTQPRITIPATNLPHRREPLQQLPCWQKQAQGVLAIPSQAAPHTLNMNTNKRSTELIFNRESGFPALSPLSSSHAGFRPPAQPSGEKPRVE